jgi:hypothetical protein
VQFDGVLTMTHHATTLDLPGGANITTAAGDVAEFFATGTNTVQCVNYTRADGTAVALADNSITLAKMAGGTDGNIISYDASGDPVAIATGDDGEVLTSTGAGSPPAFEAVAGGGAWEFVGVTAASGASIVAFTNMAAGYDYMYSIGPMTCNTDGQPFRVQVGVAGPTYRTTGYLITMTEILNGASVQSGELTTGLHLVDSGVMHMGTTGNEGIVAEYLLYDPATAATITWSRCNMTIWGSTGQVHLNESGGLYNTAAEAHTSVKFYPGTGTITGDIVQTRRKRSA